MEEVLLVRFHDDLPQLAEPDWDVPERVDAHMRAWASAAEALRRRGDLLALGSGFDQLTRTARAHGWSAAVGRRLEARDGSVSVRVGAVAALELAEVLAQLLVQANLDEVDAEAVERLIAFCRRGSFDVV